MEDGLRRGMYQSWTEEMSDRDAPTTSREGTCFGGKGRVKKAASDGSGGCNNKAVSIQREIKDKKLMPTEISMALGNVKRNLWPGGSCKEQFKLINKCSDIKSQSRAPKTSPQ